MKLLRYSSPVVSEVRKERIILSRRDIGKNLCVVFLPRGGHKVGDGSTSAARKAFVGNASMAVE